MRRKVAFLCANLSATVALLFAQALAAAARAPWWFALDWTLLVVNFAFAIHWIEEIRRG